MRQQVRRAERKWRQTRLTVHREIYTDLRDAFKQSIALAKSAYYCAEIKSSARNNKEMYRIKNDLMGRSSKTLFPKSDDGPGALADCFVTHFTDKITDIRVHLATISTRLQNNYSCFSHVALGLRQCYVFWTARDAAAATADDSKLRGTADYWNPQSRSHNTSFIQFTLVAYSSANRIQTYFTCVSRCASSMPCISVVASDSIHTHPNTEIRRSTSIDYTAVPSRAVRSSGLFCVRADTVERPVSRN